MRTADAPAIRQVFRKSPGPQWSGSAGSIYPLVDRLERRALIRSAAHAVFSDRRRLTGSRKVAGNSGRTDWVAGIPPDPLRTRVRFLGAPPAKKREAFLVSALAEVERQLQVVLEDHRRRKEKGGFEYWVARSALLAMRARLAWLRELAEALVPTCRS